jgi:hypothetical protein
MLWSQFSAIFANFQRKIGVFLKDQGYVHNFLQNLAVVWAKNANIFAKFFGEKVFKIITSVPGHPGKDLRKSNGKTKRYPDLQRLPFAKMLRKISAFFPPKILQIFAEEDFLQFFST